MSTLRVYDDPGAICEEGGTKAREHGTRTRDLRRDRRALRLGSSRRRSPYGTNSQVPAVRRCRCFASGRHRRFQCAFPPRSLPTAVSHCPRERTESRSLGAGPRGRRDPAAFETGHFSTSGQTVIRYDQPPPGGIVPRRREDRPLPPTQADSPTRVAFPCRCSATSSPAARTPECDVTAATKSLRSIAYSRESATAVTVAVRGTSRIKAISPK